ncbi:hypothetical protein [Bradyrhizobium sp. USDA 3364]
MKDLDALTRLHVCIITTEYGKAFTVDGFNCWRRDAMNEAGLPLDRRPHSRKTLGRLLADAGATAHEMMAATGHPTLAEADRYTRKRIGVAAVAVRSSSSRTTRRTGRPKPIPEAWGNRQKGEKDQRAEGRAGAP